MMVTCHSNKLTSSTSPAENPSTGRLVSSAPTAPLVRVYMGPRVPFTLSPGWRHPARLVSCRGATFELFPEQQRGLIHPVHDAWVD